MKKVIFILAIVISIFTLPTNVFSANSVSPVSPLHTATVTNNNAGGWVPFLDWADSSSGSAFIYYVEMSTKLQTNSLGYFYDSDRVGNNTFNSPITSWNVANDFIPFYLLPGTYYWHVLRWDTYANSSWSNIWSFTVPAITQTGNAKLGAMPSSFTFIANQGDTSWTAAQTLTTLNLGGSPYGQMYVSTTPNNNWLGVANGANPGEVLVGALPTGLSGGTHNGSLTLKGVKADLTPYPNVQNQNLNIPVIFKINRPPVLNAIGNKTGSENSNLSFGVSGSDPDNDTLIFTASNLPAGATFNSSTKTFNWTPGYTQSGTYNNVKFEVSDGRLKDSENITITVNNTNRAPVLNAIGNKTATEGTTLSFSVSATDADGDALSYTATGLPSGATFNPATKTFSWKPGFNQAGTYNNIKFEVSDGSLKDSETISINVNNTNRPPVLNFIGNKIVNEMSLMTFTISATDPDGNAVTYSATGLPSGASLNAITGVFTWIPGSNQVGVFPVTFKASDATLNDTEAITITVNNDATSPTTTLTTNPTSPNGSNGWYKTVPTIQLASNESGTISYSWNDTTSYDSFFDVFVEVELPQQIQGTNTLNYFSTDPPGNKEAVRNKTFKVDSVKPSVPTLSTPLISTNQSPTTGFNVSWNSTDGTSGIFGFQLQYKSNTATGWTIFKVGGNSWYANKKIRFVGTPGKTYDFKVLARDNAGNIATSVIKKTIMTLNQSVFSFSGQWSSSSQSLQYMENARYSTADGAAALYNFSNARDIFIVFTRRPNGGKFDVFIGDTKVKTIDSYGSSIEYREAVRVKTYTSASSGKVRVENTRTRNAASNGFRVEIDGIAIKK